jgi:NADH-quinone oxidoreductase subunit E/NADP-reducing hydrogenase subunit HndA
MAIISIKFTVLITGGFLMGKISAAAVAKIEEICNRYTDEKTPLMMILSDIQNEYGYIPLDVQEIVSKQTGISVAEIYGVVTFYSFFSLTPKGKYVIGCCLGTACYVKGAQQVIDKFSELLNIGPGETTEDGLFTLDALRCIGACGIAPAVTINGKVYPKMAVSQVQEVIESYQLEAEMSKEEVQS